MRQNWNTYWNKYTRMAFNILIYLRLSNNSICSIHNVDVVYDYGYLTACSADGLNSIKITFLSEFGDLPDLIPTYTNLTNGLLSGLVTVTEVTPG